jgi:polysaccharide pyruvyl transferase WcaK-like protein
MRRSLENFLQIHGFPDARSLNVRWEGGTLDSDVAGVIGCAIERLPRLTGWTFTSIGAAVPAPNALADLHQRASRLGLAFAADFVLDANADAFAVRDAREVTAASVLSPVLAASRALRDQGVPVRWLLPLVRSAVYRLEGLFSLARDQGVEPILVPHWLAHPGPDAGTGALDDDERLFVRDFLAYRLLDEDRDLGGKARIGWYEALDSTLVAPVGGDANRTYQIAVLVGDITAGHANWTVRCESRPRHDGAPEEMRMPSTGMPRGSADSPHGAQIRDIGAVLAEGALALVHWVRGLGATRRRNERSATSSAQFQRALLVGAYGGDHIGDTAILGGVLFRIRQQYGTSKAILLSQRPEHTRHLVSMLETQVAVEVDAYELENIRARLAQVDVVVFAGGPLIDLPKQLVKHFYAASLARRLGKPFIMEGIGPGPFARWPSEWTARRLVRMAEYISVRTSHDARNPLMKNLAPEIGHDPAFDYLATRGEKLTRLRPIDQQWVERLLLETEGRLLIGMNLRPIRHLFTVGGPALKRAEYTRQVEAQCEENLAQGMLLFHRACAVSPCYVYFPMNAIQFGMSDLRSAYRLQRRLHRDVDFRVWQGDAGLDGVVALLRRLDIVITMRFHATIFALSQNRRVIGIDYRIGKRDKVGDLMADFDQSENCRRIDELTATWLFERLQALAAAQGGPLELKHQSTREVLDAIGRRIR